MSVMSFKHFYEGEFCSIGQNYSSSIFMKVFIVLCDSASVFIELQNLFYTENYRMSSTFTLPRVALTRNRRVFLNKSSFTIPQKSTDNIFKTVLLMVIRSIKEVSLGLLRPCIAKSSHFRLVC